MSILANADVSAARSLVSRILPKHPRLAECAESLLLALDTLAGELARAAGVSTLQLATAGGGKVPSGPERTNALLMRGGSKGGYKRGDHLFNHGLTKLGMRPPAHPLLIAAFRRFHLGLQRIEENGGFSLVAAKVDRKKDANADLFGERVADLRNAWDQLNRVIESPRLHPQHWAVAVFMAQR